MKRSELEKFLGKNVEVKLFYGNTIVGELHKTGEEMYKSNPGLYLKKNYYFCESGRARCLFRCSHVIKIKED